MMRAGPSDDPHVVRKNCVAILLSECAERRAWLDALPVRAQVASRPAPLRHFPFRRFFALRSFIRLGLYRNQLELISFLAETNVTGARFALFSARKQARAGKDRRSAPPSGPPDASADSSPAAAPGAGAGPDEWPPSQNFPAAPDELGVRLLDRVGHRRLDRVARSASRWREAQAVRDPAERPRRTSGCRFVVKGSR